MFKTDQKNNKDMIEQNSSPIKSMKVSNHNLEKLAIASNKIFTGTEDNFFIMIGEQKNVLRLNYLFPR
jgi:hypothetical protein